MDKKPNYSKKILIFTLTSLVITGCASTKNVIHTEQGETIVGSCPSESRVVTSSSKHIIIEHKFQNMGLAKSTALKWCNQFPKNPSPKVEKQYCTECCQTSFQCR